MFDGIPPSAILEGEYTSLDGMNTHFMQVKPEQTRAFVYVSLGKGGYGEKFPALARGLYNRGLHAFFHDLPGQGLSDRYLEGENLRQRNHVPSFDDLIFHAYDFYREVIEPIQDGHPLIGYSHSQGGQIQTRLTQEYSAMSMAALIQEAPLYEFAVKDPKERLLSVFRKSRNGFQQRKDSLRPVKMPWYAKTYIWGAVMLGQGTSYAPGEKDYDPDRLRFEESNTSNETHFKNNKKRLADDRRKIVSGSTNQYVIAARRSIRQTRKRGYLEQVKTPVLVFAGEEDGVTPPHLIRPFVDRMPNAELVVLEGAKHDLPGEPLPIRREKWRRVDQFLQQHVFH